LCFYYSLLVFPQRVINVWNIIPKDIVDFISITSQRTIKLFNVSAHLGHRR